MAKTFKALTELADWEPSLAEKQPQPEKTENPPEEHREERKHSERERRMGSEGGSRPEFGDLTSIISQNWDQFEPHLRNQDWRRHIISTLERSRNVIMHGGELSNSDLERIGTVIRDWVKQAGA